MTKRPKKIKYNDYPLWECQRVAERKMREGWRVHQKFTCENCGSRQTMADHNVFYAQGRCEECNHVTDLRLRGCNYVLIGTSELPIF